MKSFLSFMVGIGIGLVVDGLLVGRPLLSLLALPGLVISIWLLRAEYR